MSANDVITSSAESTISYLLLLEIIWRHNVIPRWYSLMETNNLFQSSFQKVDCVLHFMGIQFKVVFFIQIELLQVTHYTTDSLEHALRNGIKLRSTC